MFVRGEASGGGESTFPALAMLARAHLVHRIEIGCEQFPRQKRRV
tara:strand:- start:137 stop:271 length:135 start_codon:yes stop_codon:yes gene_type:complete